MTEEERWQIYEPEPGEESVAWFGCWLIVQVFVIGLLVGGSCIALVWLYCK